MATKTPYCNEELPTLRFPWALKVSYFSELLLVNGHADVKHDNSTANGGRDGGQGWGSGLAITHSSSRPRSKAADPSPGQPPDLNCPGYSPLLIRHTGCPTARKGGGAGHRHPEREAPLPDHNLRQRGQRPNARDPAATA